MANLVVICFGCHQRHHAGQLTITGRAPDLQFRWQRDDDVESAMALSPRWDWVPVDLPEPGLTHDEVDTRGSESE